MYDALRRQRWLYDVDHDSMRWEYRRVAHAILRLATRASGLRYRVLRPAWSKNGSTIRLNLGSGRRPLHGWINVDINPFAHADAWLDLRDAWPFADDGVEAIYMRHCLEHFTESDVLRILRQCHRVLAPEKGLRIGSPSLEFALEEYLHGDFAFVPWVAEHATSPGRRFFSYMMDDGNHGIMFDFSYLAELLALVGFTDIQRVSGGQSTFLERAQLSPLDNPEDAVTLYVEARKPGRATC
jgi:predicted SAM-dependent methyltransferase